MAIVATRRVSCCLWKRQILFCLYVLKTPITLFSFGLFSNISPYLRALANLGRL